MSGWVCISSWEGMGCVILCVTPGRANRTSLLHIPCDMAYTYNPQTVSGCSVLALPGEVQTDEAVCVI